MDAPAIYPLSYKGSAPALSREKWAPSHHRFAAPGPCPFAATAAGSCRDPGIRALPPAAWRRAAGGSSRFGITASAGRLGDRYAVRLARGHEDSDPAGSGPPVPPRFSGDRPSRGPSRPREGAGCAPGVRLRLESRPRRRPSEAGLPLPGHGGGHGRRLAAGLTIPARIRPLGHGLVRARVRRLALRPLARFRTPGAPRGARGRDPRQGFRCRRGALRPIPQVISYGIVRARAASSSAVISSPS